ncbi:hypothetical protein M3148_16150 [Georgenia satyanarayanai]|uniref:hypothetical protein n=1 Tax=Georgenia satyanarayanai TaxID=860221 RepID=UPI00203C2EC4|nr:hypothetical protein [Georgenia satyanarayanai]MCM3662510.1 hypothetical protein [Georgenia satyanarayanai]
MAVYLDGHEPSATPALDCAGVRHQRWNGFIVPLATADSFRAFVAAWKLVDPHGPWRLEGVRTEGDRLVYEDRDGAVDYWVAGGTEDRATTYELDGWMWVEA